MAKQGEGQDFMQSLLYFWVDIQSSTVTLQSQIICSVPDSQDCHAHRYAKAKASLTSSFQAMAVKIDDLQRRMGSQAAMERQRGNFPPPQPMYGTGFGGMPPPQPFEEPLVTQADVKAAEKQQSRVKVCRVPCPYSSTRIIHCFVVQCAC